MSLYAYPSVADAEAALQIVWSDVTGNGGVVPPKDLIQASWICVGYAASIGVPVVLPHATPAAPGDAMPNSAALVEARAAFKAAALPHVGPRTIGDGTILKGIGSILGSLPWSTLIPILLQIISKAPVAAAAV